MYIYHQGNMFQLQGAINRSLYKNIYIYINIYLYSYVYINIYLYSYIYIRIYILI